jgi:hypothetical protein
MARVTYVQSARIRIDKETGAPKPLHTCDKCETEIQIGAPYKHMSVKTGPYSSRKLIRCGACPDWYVWEYSSSLSARIAEIEHHAREAVATAEDKDAVESALTEAAEAIRELAEEKRDGAQNIEDGFGHPTTQSEELIQQADDLDAWADEIESADVPEDPDPEDAECEACEGYGQPEPGDAQLEQLSLPANSVFTIETVLRYARPCTECDGTGHPEEATEDQWDDWRTEVDNALSVLDNCPV